MLSSCSIHKDVNYEEKEHLKEVCIVYNYWFNSLGKEKCRKYLNHKIIQKEIVKYNTDGAWEKEIYRKSIIYNEITGDRIEKKIFVNYRSLKSFRRYVKRKRRLEKKQ